ncbi:MAG: hypothetical protein AAFR11_05330 [Pseudomonadota bacterium]
MTSEVVLMNRQAVAMAADSAVTITGGSYLKTYQSADKLFPLVEGQPVAVMIYNNAEIMSTPWETVISLYREQVAGRPLDTVDQYAEDFMAFLSGNMDLFPAADQDTEYFKLVAVVFSVIFEEFAHQVEEFKRNNSGRLREHIPHIFEFVVNHLYYDYEKNFDDSPRADLNCFPKGMAEQLRRRYGAEVEELIDSLIAAVKQEFAGFSVTDETRRKLRDISVLAVTRDAFFEHYTGVVFAGFGRSEKFPSMRSYLASSVVLGILKRRQDRAATMSADAGPVIQPFAQDRMIRTFLTGIDPYLRLFMFGETLKLTTNIAADLIGKAPNMSEDQRQQLFQDYSDNTMVPVLREFFRSMDAYQHAVHTAPIFRAVQMLPKKELGETAASLIKLNSFQQKVTAAVETVGGPVDTAVITRNGGLEMRQEKADL